jgi:rare lipoprotein A
MRPQLTWRAARAGATVCALMLAVGVSGRIASASTSSPIRATHARRPGRPQLRRAGPARLRAFLLHANVLIGQDVAYVGQASSGGAGRTIAIQILEGRRWLAVARTLTDRRGLFHVRFWPQRLGRLQLRLRAGGIPPRRLILSGALATAYHQVIASWYGPGGVTACGESLGAATQGVANKTLPCGTLVTLRYRGRVVRVPVIDRGPFVPGRDYDLTYATRLALGAGDVSEIWASA